MKTDFIPLDYDYFDFNEKNHIKIFGRNSEGKRICVIDDCEIYFWAILKQKTPQKKIEKIKKEIQEIEIDSKGRKTKVEKVEVHDKKFLNQDVKALKIFATNYKDLQDIADKLDYEEIDKRRGYDLGFITHYIIEKNINPLEWYEIGGHVITSSDNSTELGGVDSNLDVDFCIRLEKSKKTQKKDFSPKILAFDIETDELKIGEGEILMISLVGNNGFKKVITWKKTKKAHEYIEQVNSEKELIKRFLEIVREQSPDILTGYFSDGFDMPYLKERAKKHKIKFSLNIDGSQPKISRRGESSTCKTTGITHIDILKFIRTAYSQYMSSETLSLNEVSKEFLGDKKTDFKIKHSSKLDKDEMEKYFEYNLQDSVLTKELFEKFWPDMMEFSKIVKEPLCDSSRASLSKQVESYILHNLEKFNEIPEKRPGYNEIAKRRSQGGVEGAFVYEPTPGLYEDIVFFDFTSMHTSIIISHNISKGTLLEKRKKGSYETPEMELNNEKKKFYFTKKPGFFPELMKEIFEKRKQHKKEYKQNPNAITQARSNAFKTLSASIHGYLGFFGARYYSKEASASVLSLVRKYNKDTIENIKNKGHDIIYGDSVGGETKVWAKKGDKISKTNIQNLFKKTDKLKSGKEYDLKKDIKVLTLDEKGNSVFKPLKYVMRHKTNKKMYRIHFTNNWSIDVTEDHSLIGYQSHNFNQTKRCKNNELERITEIKPSQIHKKANSIVSLKKIPGEEDSSKEYPKEVYEFLGFFIGDGSFCQNKIQKQNNKDYYLDLSCGNDYDEIIKKLAIPLKKKGWIKNYWKSNTRKGDIKINGQRLIKIVKENCKNKNKKSFPEFLFREKKENIMSFLRGYFSADGTVILRNNCPIIKLTSINNEFIEKTKDLLCFCGISNTSFKENNKNSYKKKTSNTYSKNILIKDKGNFSKKIGFILTRKNKKAAIKSKTNQKNSIKKYDFDLQYVKQIEKIPKQEYVYDIEVEDNHRFFANNVLVHNTDSIAFLKNKKSNKEINSMLKKINENLPGVMHLELEGFFKRGIWVSTREGKIGAKKKYALIDSEGEMKIRGFETVRRDWCALARDVQNKVLQKILENGNEKEALEYLKEIVKKIKNRKVRKEDLIIKTQLKKPLSEYKAISPHVIAAKKMREKEIPISEGNLIKYYVSESGKESKKLVRERVKLPEEEGKYDIEYYLNKQILPAVENIFMVFGITHEELLQKRKQTKLGDF